jgi:hypothetical protein
VEIKPIEEIPIKEEIVINSKEEIKEPVVETKEERPDVVFEPTTEEALNLYSEESKTPTPTPTHTYAKTGADRYR